MYFFLPGTPFIYQGQELGIKNFHRNSINDFNDISSINNYHLAIENGIDKTKALNIVNQKSRDNARTPMQWDDSKFGGFSENTPWLKMGNDRENIDEQNEDTLENSVLNFYRKMISVHHEKGVSKLITEGTFTEIKEVPEDVIAYKLTNIEHCITILVNLSNTEQTLKHSFEGLEKLNNYSDVAKRNNTLLPYQAIMIYK